MTSDRQPATVQISRKLLIATENVRAMYQTGKLTNIDRERRRLSVDINGVSEVRWTGADLSSLRLLDV